MSKLKVSLSLSLLFASTSAFAEGDAWQPILDALNFDSSMPLVVAGGAAVVAFMISKGAILGLVGMIRGAAR